MEQKDIDLLAKSNTPVGVTLLDIDKATLTPGIVNGTYFLTVTGTKPWITMKVSFVRLIYIRKPEYWGIQVIGTQNGIGLPTVSAYSHTEDVSFSIGTKGIEVMGANKAIQLQI